ncbi:MAG: universal stress protein [Nitrospirae bacterium]|nr:universal stress protein [Nitrospirota bacterium]
MSLTARHRTNMMGELKSILLATDGSDNSNGAVKEAIGFSRDCKTVLRLLRVIEINPAYESMGFHYTDKMKETAMAEFDDIRELAASHNVECDIAIKRSESVYGAIIQEANRYKSDIIIMGKHGMTGLRKMLLGSVTAKVIATSPTKVLVVPRDSEIRGESILLAVDGSKCSQIAEDEAINMASRCDVIKNMIVVSVAQSKDKLPYAQEILDKVKKKAHRRGVNVETLALVGQPYKAIVNASLECGSDIIIVGTHRRTGIASILMGSVAQQVIALSMCPVLVVKDVPQMP